MSAGNLLPCTNQHSTLNTLTKVRRFKFFKGELETKAPRAQIIALLLSDSQRMSLHFVSGIGTKRPAPVRNYLASRWSLPMGFWACPLLWDKDSVLDSVENCLSSWLRVRAPSARPQLPLCCPEGCGWLFQVAGIQSSGSVRTCVVGVADTNTTAYFFSLAESCPPDLLTILSLTLCGPRQHVNLQTALCGSCQNAHFTSWLFQAHHQRRHG